MNSFFASTFDDIYNFARANSLSPLVFATSCCGAEVMSAAYSDSDANLSGTDIAYTCSPKQADLLIVAGTITHKVAPELLKLYKQMPEPKYVIAMGACACSGGMFCKNSYSVVYGVDKILPVDIYLPMCPPKPEALFDALTKLQAKIKSESLYLRKKYISENMPKLIYGEDVLLQDNVLTREI